MTFHLSKGQLHRCFPNGFLAVAGLTLQTLCPVEFRKLNCAPSSRLAAGSGGPITGVNPPEGEGATFQPQPDS